MVKKDVLKIDGRIRYIEPNNLSNELSNGVTSNNMTWDYDDMPIYVDLEVVVPERDSCGLTDYKTQVEITNLKNTPFVSPFQGKKIGERVLSESNKEERRALTTSYTDISFREISNGNLKENETLGINSIDINFDNNFYPVITMHLTDVRGAALMAPMAVDAAIADEEKKNAKDYASLFRALFRFPYPLFFLTIQGHYGTKVTFNLAFSKIDTKLNSQTGNFDVDINFIGHVYGVYTDIPMMYLITAPYQGLGREIKDLKELPVCKYWLENYKSRFRFTEDEPMQTFIEFHEKYKKIGDKISKAYNDNIENYRIDTDVSNKRKLLIILSEVISSFKNYFMSLYDNKNYINFIENYNKIIRISKNTTNASESEELKILNNKIKEYNDFVEGKVLEKLPTLKENYKTYNGDIFIYDEENKEYVLNNENNLIKSKDENQIISSFIKCLQEQDNQSYALIKETLVESWDFENILEKYQDIEKELNKSIDESESSKDDRLIESIKKALEFSPSIENIMRMLYAHLDTFMHNYYSVLKEIKSNNRTLTDLNLSIEETDIKSKSKNCFVPPFPAIYRDRKSIYPGDAGLVNLEELKLIDNIFDSVEGATVLPYSEEEEEDNAIKDITFTSISDIKLKDNPYITLLRYLEQYNDIYENKDYEYKFSKKFILLLYFLNCRILSMAATNGFFSNKIKNLDSNDLKLVLDYEFENIFTPLKKYDGYNDIKEVLKKDFENFSVFDTKTLDYFNSFMNENFKDCLNNGFKQYTYNILGYNKEKTENLPINFIDPFVKNEEGDGDGRIFYKECEGVKLSNCSTQKIREWHDIEDNKYISKEEDKYRDTFLERGIKYNSFTEGRIYSKIKDKTSFNEYNENEREEGIGENYDNLLYILKKENNDFYLPYLTNNKVLKEGGGGLVLSTKKENINIFDSKGEINKFSDYNAKAYIFLASIIGVNTLDLNKLFTNAFIGSIPRHIYLFLGAVLWRERQKEDPLKDYSKTPICLGGLCKNDKNVSELDKIFFNEKGFQNAQEYFEKWVKEEFKDICDNITNSLKEENKDKEWVKDENNEDLKMWTINSNVQNIFKHIIFEDVIVEYYPPSDNDNEVDMPYLGLNSIFTSFIKRFKDKFNEEDTKESNKQNYERTNQFVESAKSSLKKNIYYTLKHLYDKWLASYKEENFILPAPDETNEKSEFSSFIYIDSYYRDISKEFYINPELLWKTIDGELNGDTSYSMAEFMGKVAHDNHLLFLNLPIGTNMYNEEDVINIFKPSRLVSSKRDTLSTSYIFIYTYEMSYVPDMEEPKFEENGVSIAPDGFNIIKGSEITSDAKELFRNEDSNKQNHLINAFGVSFGKQNQSYFKNIEVSTDNPRETDYSLANLLRISQEGSANGTDNNTFISPQSLFPIYSNRSYFCRVEMMGCANIMPTMYFQLNNCPMFNGVYMIYKVEHHIKNGSMTTIFMGNKVSKVSTELNKNIIGVLNKEIISKQILGGEDNLLETPSNNINNYDENLINKAKEEEKKYYHDPISKISYNTSTISERIKHEASLENLSTSNIGDFNYTWKYGEGKTEKFSGGCVKSVMQLLTYGFKESIDNYRDSIGNVEDNLKLYNYEKYNNKGEVGFPNIVFIRYNQSKHFGIEGPINGKDCGKIYNTLGFKCIYLIEKDTSSKGKVHRAAIDKKIKDIINDGDLAVLDYEKYGHTCMYINKNWIGQFTHNENSVVPNKDLYLGNGGFNTIKIYRFNQGDTKKMETMKLITV